jgi:DNA-directed RNA polymerase specialized sigma24 family protein
MSESNDHLSQIHTLWSVVRTAHGDDPSAVRQAQERLLATYGGAARRYLLAALRNGEAADEVFQEFSLKLLRGDFRNVSPDRGKFRHFLKTCLYRLIVDHQRRQKRQPVGMADAGHVAERLDPATDAAMDSAFLKSWREELLTRSWRKLELDEQTTGKPYYTILRLRAEHPEASSTDLAALAAEKLQREISPVNARVLLHRARELFAECLLDAVVHSLPHADRDDVEEELIELQLLEYCRAALEQRPTA